MSIIGKYFHLELFKYLLKFSAFFSVRAQLFDVHARRTYACAYFFLLSTNTYTEYNKSIYTTYILLPLLPLYLLPSTIITSCFSFDRYLGLHFHLSSTITTLENRDRVFLHSIR